MEKLIEYLIDLAKSWPTYLILAVVVFVFCVCQIDNLVKFKASVCGLFSGISRRARKGQIANSLRGSILSAAKKKEFTSLGILPSDMKIVWADNDTVSSFFADNKVVIRIKQDENPNVNYVKILSQFVTTGLFKNGRHYFDDTVLRAADLVVAQDIVATSRPTAHKEFLDHVYTPAIENDPNVKSDYDMLCNLSKAGLLYLVYLNELNKMQASMIGQLPDECLRAESREVLYFLNNIAIKKSDNPDELNICNNYFKFGIVYAINDRTMRHSGYKAHQRVIQKLIENEYKTIYVIASGRKRDSAKEIAYEAKNSIPEIVSSSTHKFKGTHISTGKRTEGICVELNTY